MWLSPLHRCIHMCAWFTHIYTSIVCECFIHIYSIYTFTLTTYTHSFAIICPHSSGSWLYIHTPLVVPGQLASSSSLSSLCLPEQQHWHHTCITCNCVSSCTRIAHIYVPLHEIQWNIYIYICNISNYLYIYIYIYIYISASMIRRTQTICTQPVYTHTIHLEHACNHVNTWLWIYTL